MTAHVLVPGSLPPSRERSGTLATKLAEGVILGLEPDDRHEQRRDEPDAPTALLRLRPQSPGVKPAVVWLGLGDLPRGCRVVDLATLCRDGGLAGRAATERHLVLQAVLDSVGDIVDPVVGRDLAVTLGRLRDILRERLPRCTISKDGLHGLHVDAFVAMGNGSYYLRGWSHTVARRTARLTLVSPEGHRAELADVAAPIPRPDVADFFGLCGDTEISFGWAAMIDLPDVLRPAATGWLVELEDETGHGVEAPCPSAIDQRDAILDTLLGDLTVPRPQSERLRADHLRPAVSAHLEHRRSALQVREDETWGPQPTSPEVSIIVPLYRRIDFVEHQLAQFVHDQEIAEAELIYVLDSPEQQEALSAMAGRLHRLYGLSFRTISLSMNAGYSEANNVGAAAASGRLLLLLNSDVIPDRPGWLGELVAKHDAIDDIGAIAPKLLYEDDSLQHAGIVFERPPGTRLWNNEHRFKGLDRGFLAAQVPCAVPAVTGACLLIDAALYESLGGLRGWYVQGDFEDTDLCLRLWELGRSVWYEPSVELYHLESQSYPSAARRRNGEYNRWLHTHLWDDQIAALVDRLARAT
jgi:GT2 family glycosyltransferase